MEESGKKKWWQKIDVIDIVIATAIIPVAEKTLKPMVEGAVKYFTKKATDVLGFDLASGKEEVIDDFYFRSGQSELKPEERIKIYDFKHWLKEHDKQVGPDEEGAFILYVAKMVKTFEREKKEISGGGKGGSQKQECTYKDLEKGVALATGFFRDLLSKGDHEAMRHFLDNEKVFTLIPKKKEDSPIITKAKKNWENFSSKSSDDSVVAAKCRYEESKLKRKNSQGGQQ